MQFAKALEAMRELVRMFSRYAGTQASRVPAREGRLKTVLYVLPACRRKIAILLWPVMPRASETMLQQPGQDTDRGVCPDMSVEEEIPCFGGLCPGTAISSSSNILPRI